MPGLRFGKEKIDDYCFKKEGKLMNSRDMFKSTTSKTLLLVP